MLVRHDRQFHELPADAIWVIFKCIRNINNLLMLRLVNKMSKQVIDRILSQPRVILMMLEQCRSQKQFKSLCQYLNSNAAIREHIQRSRQNRSIADDIIEFYLTYWNPDLDICQHPTSHTAFFEIAKHHYLFRQETLLPVLDFLPPKLMRSYINTIATIRNVDVDACFATHEPSIQYLYYAMTISDIKNLDPIILKNTMDLIKETLPLCDILERVLIGLQITLAAIDSSIPPSETNDIIKKLPSFIYVNLNGAQFHHLDFTDCDLRYYSLIGATFSHCNFKRTCLRGVNLSRANFTACHFNHTNLEYANFVDSHAGSTLFDHARLKGADFSNAYLLNVLFENSNLNHATFNNATLLSVNFIQTTMVNCSLLGCDLASTEFNKIDFKSINWAVDKIFKPHYFYIKTLNEISRLKNHQSVNDIVNAICELTIDYAQMLAIKNPSAAINYLNQALQSPLFKSGIIFSSIQFFSRAFNTHLLDSIHQSLLLDCRSAIIHNTQKNLSHYLIFN